MQREFVEEFQKERPWIFDFINEKYKYNDFEKTELKDLRHAKINVNRIVAYKFTWPICMTYEMFLGIQAQRIFSLFNCPNCKYTWRLFQKYVREMILQSWSLMIDKFDLEMKMEDKKNKGSTSQFTNWGNSKQKQGSTSQSKSWADQFQKSPYQFANWGNSKQNQGSTSQSKSLENSKQNQESTSKSKSLENSKQNQGSTSQSKSLENSKQNQESTSKSKSWADQFQKPPYQFTNWGNSKQNQGSTSQSKNLGNQNQKPSHQLTNLGNSKQNQVSTATSENNQSQSKEKEIISKYFDEASIQNKNDTRKEKLNLYEQKLIEKKKELLKALEKYFPKNKSMGIVLNFIHICNQVINDHQEKILTNLNKLGRAFIDFGNYEKAAGIDGVVDKVSIVRSDPGENVKIRVFVDFEMPSNIFNNEHEVFIDEDCTLNLTDIDTVNQNIESGINIDNLHFENASRILLKPNNISINIMMKQKKKGSIFNIEMDTFLRLNVTNSDEKDIMSSRLPVSGFGELNCYDYPFERIRPQKTVKVIKGVYIICGVNEGNKICAYQSIERYKRLDHLSRFKPNMDPNSKILVFLDSYTSSIDANLRYLSGQKIQFIRKEQRKSSLLNHKKESVKLRFLSTTELTNKEDSTTGLSSINGGAILDNSDLDLFVVGFDENLTIKQEGNVSLNASTITIQPMSDKGTIFIDDSVDIENKKLRIESENDKKVSLTIRTNKNVTEDETLLNFIDIVDSNIEVTFGDPANTKSKGFPVGLMAGIIVGAVVIVSIIVAVIIFVVNKKRHMKQDLSTDNQEFSDSTF